MAATVAATPTGPPNLALLAKAGKIDDNATPACTVLSAVNPAINKGKLFNIVEILVATSFIAPPIASTPPPLLTNSLNSPTTFSMVGPNSFTKFAVNALN